MKIAIYTVIPSPHQLPLAHVLVRRVGADNFRYVSVRGLPKERENVCRLGVRVAGRPHLRHDAHSANAALTILDQPRMSLLCAKEARIWYNVRPLRNLVKKDSMRRVENGIRP